MINIISNIFVQYAIKKALKKVKNKLMKNPNNKRLYEEYRKKTAHAIKKLSFY